MSKKNFKADIATGADRFFSVHDVQDIEDTRNTSNTDNTQSTMDVQSVSDVQPYYRINLKLNGGYKTFLADEAWKRRMSITELLNTIIGEFQARVETEDAQS